jgi:hypothetical protein
MSKSKNIVQAARAHTDLNIFAAVVAILEGGCIYTAEAKGTVSKIINLCQVEQRRQLELYDKAVRCVEQGKL